VRVHGCELSVCGYTDVNSVCTVHGCELSVCGYADVHSVGTRMCIQCVRVHGCELRMCGYTDVRSVCAWQQRQRAISHPGLGECVM